MYCMRSPAWICSLSQDSCSSIPTTPLSTALASVMIMLRYHSANYAATFSYVIAAIAPLAFHVAVVTLLWAGVRCWKSALLMTEVISWSNWLGAGKRSSLLRIRRLATIRHAAIDVGPSLVGAFWLWVQGSTFYHHLAGVGAGLWLGSCCCSGFCLSCSFSLGWSFGWCCSWRISNSPSCVAPASCEASRPPPSHLAVSSLSFFLTSWACAALPTLDFTSTSVVMSVMPVCHRTLCLWQSSHFVSLYCSYSFMPSHCVSSHTVCSSILDILLIVWCSCITSCAYCLIVCSMRLLQSPWTLADSVVSLLRVVQFLLRSHCSLAAMQGPHAVTVELCGHNIICVRYAAGASGNQRYYFLFKIFETHVFCLYSQLYIYQSMYQYRLPSAHNYLGRLQLVLE